MSPPLALGGRYELLGELGRGRAGTTWRARCLETGRLVALKERPLAKWESFRDLERCEREAELCASLSHPRIPAFVGGTLVEDGASTAYLLATELVEGAPLSAELTGPRRTAREVLLDLAALLDVLAYLHGLSPAVVHADVSLANVVRRTADGALFLVDLHSARHHPEARAAGVTTALGTPGFLAPEQLAGRAEPKTDIWAAGCVAVSLLARRPPHELVDARGALAWRRAVAVSPSVERLLARMLEPDLRRRCGSASELAAEARRLASGGAEARRWLALPAALGAGSLALVAMAAWSSLREPAQLREAPAEMASASSSAAAAPVAASPDLATLRFPDTPGSACQARRDCLPVGDGKLFEPARAACVEARAGGERSFTNAFAGMTAFCTAKVLARACMASCTLRFRHIDALVFQQRAEDVAQFVRDAYGHASWSPPWRQFPLRSGFQSLSRGWTWSRGGVRLDVKADWRPIPAESDAPSDVHVDMQLAVDSG